MIDYKQMFPKIGISVNIFGKNNEDCIERALKSVVPFANEIIYLDTGSTDNTIDIVKKYTDKIHIQKVWPMDYSYCRNFLISKSEMQWILAIDTDEVVTNQFAEKIRGLLNNFKYIQRPINFIFFKMINLIQDEKHIAGILDNNFFLFHPRLYKRIGSQWIGKVHEQYKGKGEGMFWDMFGLVHYNLLMIERLRKKDGRQWVKDLSDEKIANLYAHNAPINKLPKEITWLTKS